MSDVQQLAMELPVDDDAYRPGEDCCICGRPLMLAPSRMFLTWWAFIVGAHDHCRKATREILP